MIMGLDPTTLPDAFKRRMAGRPKGKEWQTTEEAQAKFEARQERDLHEKFEQWLRLNGIAYVHSRMDRKATTASGTLDFICLANSYGCCVEWKVKENPSKYLSENQIKWLADAQKAGVPCLVTNDLAIGILFTKEALRL